MNREEAKQILLLYRPGTADAADPQVAEALALAEKDGELAKWLADHNARQARLREKFRQVAPPAGLMEQIISEQAANRRMLSSRRRFIQIATGTAVAIVAVYLGIFWFKQPPPADNTLAIFKQQMRSNALRVYKMDLQTNDAGQILAYLKQKHSPADDALPPPLQQTAPIGCAVESWQSTKVSMICFRTGQPLPAGVQNDLWLFVADEKTVKDAPPDSAPHISRVNELVTATWVKNGRLYLLGTTADESVLRKFL